MKIYSLLTIFRGEYEIIHWIAVNISTYLFLTSHE